MFVDKGVGKTCSCSEEQVHKQKQMGRPGACSTEQAVSVLQEVGKTRGSLVYLLPSEEGGMQRDLREVKSTCRRQSCRENVSLVFSHSCSDYTEVCLD